MPASSPASCPPGMVANVPWGTPLHRWNADQLQRGLAACEDSPRLAASIRAELGQ